MKNKTDLKILKNLPEIEMYPYFILKYLILNIKQFDHTVAMTPAVMSGLDFFMKNIYLFVANRDALRI